MQPIRVKTVQESDLRMLGDLARNIQRVLPVTQADIDAAAALGKGWVVWKVIEVNDPIDNLRGGTQLIIRQNSIQPGQNVRRVIFVAGPGGQTVVIRGTNYIVLPDAIANSLSYVKAFGGTEQNGTPTPDAPVDIVSNNGVLKYSKNLLDMSAENIVLGKYINNGGVVTDSPANFYNRKYMPVVAGETYTWSTSSSIGYFSVMEYDSNYAFKKRTLFSNVGTSGSITLRSDTAFVLIGSNMDGTDATLDKVAAVDWQFEKGSSATAYKPYSPTGIYTDGTVETIKDSLNNTATAEMLLKVGDYTDVQSILDGVVTRKVGVKVLDGTEDWESTSTAGLWLLCNVEETVLPSTCICSHFLGVSTTTSGLNMPDLSMRYGVTGYDNRLYIRHNSLASADNLKQLLAEQYNAGTPVIVVYTLETPTTESVTGQTLQVQDGDNTLTITQAGMSGLELEAEYQAVVTLTVQEVEDANLDNNVTVTIN